MAVIKIKYAANKVASLSLPKFSGGTAGDMIVAGELAFGGSSPTTAGVLVIGTGSQDANAIIGGSAFFDQTIANYIGGTAYGKTGTGSNVLATGPTLSGAVSITGASASLTVGTVSVYVATTLYGNLTVGGTTVTLADTTTIKGTGTTASTAVLTIQPGNAANAGTLAVSGNVSISGNLNVGTNNSGKITVRGVDITNGTITSPITVDTFEHAIPGVTAATRNSVTATAFKAYDATLSGYALTVMAAGYIQTGTVMADFLVGPPVNGQIGSISGISAHTIDVFRHATDGDLNGEISANRLKIIAADGSTQKALIDIDGNITANKLTLGSATAGITAGDIATSGSVTAASFSATGTSTFSGVTSFSYANGIGFKDFGDTASSGASPSYFLKAPATDLTSAAGIHTFLLPITAGTTNTSTDSLVSLTSSDVLTNKTLTSPVITDAGASSFANTALHSYAYGISFKDSDNTPTPAYIIRPSTDGLSADLDTAASLTSIYIPRLNNGSITLTNTTGTHTTGTTIAFTAAAANVWSAGAAISGTGIPAGASVSTASTASSTSLTLAGGVILTSAWVNGNTVTVLPFDVFAVLNGTQTFTNKTLTSPAISSISTNSGAATITLPTATGTLATLAGSESFTNKTGYNGLSITANSGTITAGTWNGTAIGATYGGTGLSTYAVGDMLYAGSVNPTQLSKIPVQSSFYILGGGTIPTWTTTPTVSTLNLAASDSQLTFNGPLFAGTLTWTPTVSTKTITLPDLTGTVMLVGGGQTVTSGLWNGTAIGATYGGTGVNNGNNTITLGGNFVTAAAFATAGAFATTLTATAATNVTLPTTGTLATLAGSNESFTNKTGYNGLSITANTGTITAGTWNAGAVTSSGAISGTNVSASGTLAVTGIATFTAVPVCTTAPTTDTQLANKAYVDGVALGLHVHPPADAILISITGDLDIGASGVTNTLVLAVTGGTSQVITYGSGANGYAVGQIAISAASGTLALTIDSIPIASWTRIVIAGEGNRNGIYDKTSVTALLIVLTRAVDANQIADINGGDFVFIKSGTLFANCGFVQTAVAGALTLDGTFTPLFSQFSYAGVVTAGDGLTKTGTKFAVGAGTGISVADDAVSVSTTYAGGGSITTVGNVTTGTIDGGTF